MLPRKHSMRKPQIGMSVANADKRAHDLPSTPDVARGSTAGSHGLLPRYHGAF
tara:strand:+ start:1571 stop:1729 length:159 start_codon:yes stop_codon:yes gene_type:complete